MSVAAILTWCGKDCLQGALQRDYVESVAWTSGLRQSSRTLKAPPGTEAVKIELVLRWTDAGSVVWRDVTLQEVDRPKSRVIRVATTHLTPPIPSSAELNLHLMETMLDRAGATKADLVCLSENVISRGIDMPVTERARTLAAPAMALLARKASQYSMYIATTLEERDGDAIYNTALLYDRAGKIKLKYRKSHLPLNEAEVGYTPGSEYPVVDTDFGRIGVLICWDYWFPEPARILRLKGAELLLLPMAGDSGVHWDAVSRTRAMENGVYLVASGLVPASSSRIVNPAGKVLAEISGPSELAFQDIDLNQEFRDAWLSVGPGLGEGKSLYIKERRANTYAPLAR